MAEVSLPRSAAGPTRLGRQRARLREWAATTPGRLRLAMAAVMLAALVAGLVLAGVTAVHRDAVDAVTTGDEPLMVEADGLYASLADADATAAATFLRGGIEPAELRARYLADLRRASLQLTSLARRAQGSPKAAAAVAAVGAELPVYSGLMETARANNREGFPVGAAYLRQASDLMRGRILPAAGRLHAVEAGRLGDHQRTGTATGGLAAILAIGAAALAVLVGVQVFLVQRTNRVFNVPLVAATLMLVVATAWTAIALVRSRDALARAQRDGSDAVQVFSAARILWLRAQADESLTLVARGGGDRYLADYDIVLGALGPPGLLAEAEGLARRSGTTAAFQDLTASLRGLRGEHRRVAHLATEGDFGNAVRVAVGRGSREAALGDRVNRDFGAAIGAAQARFERAADDARGALGSLAVGIPLLLVLCAALGVFGLQQRMNEYR
jgi:hypothetical protein